EQEIRPPRTNIPSTEPTTTITNPIVLHENPILQNALALTMSENSDQISSPPQPPTTNN
ncbi:unnamed protein product, partial [Rotaria sordida]